MSDQVLVTANAALPPAGQSEQKGQRMSTQWTPTYKIAFKTATDKSSETNMGISSNRCVLLYSYAQGPSATTPMALRPFIISEDMRITHRIKVQGHYGVHWIYHLPLE